MQAIVCIKSKTLGGEREGVIIRKEAQGRKEIRRKYVNAIPCNGLKLNGRPIEASLVNHMHVATKVQTYTQSVC